MTRKSDKRDRLVAAALDVIYRRGYARTTLAAVAAEADVPLGNVYYHFRTKDSLVEAVIDERIAQLEQQLCDAEVDDPLESVVRYLESNAELAEERSRYGCPHGSLTHELEKVGGELGAKARRLFRIQVTWIGDRLRRAGLDDAETLAMETVAAAQGAILVAQALGEPSVITSQFDRIADRIRRIGASQPA